MREFVLMSRGYWTEAAYTASNFRILAYITNYKGHDGSMPLPGVEKFWPLHIDEEKDEEEEVSYLKNIMEQFKSGKLYN